MLFSWLTWPLKPVCVPVCCWVQVNSWSVSEPHCVTVGWCLEMQLSAMSCCWRCLCCVLFCIQLTIFVLLALSLVSCPRA
jgi:hypothetical protein